MREFVVQLQAMVQEPCSHYDIDTPIIVRMAKSIRTVTTPS